FCGEHVLTCRNVGPNHREGLKLTRRRLDEEVNLLHADTHAVGKELDAPHVTVWIERLRDDGNVGTFAEQIATAWPDDGNARRVIVEVVVADVGDGATFAANQIT